MSQPTLSICIPTYNRAELLRETLDHLVPLAEAFNLEVVVSDNASPDHTGEVIEAFRSRFKAFRSWRQSENRGAFVNITASLNLATGRYVYTLCDDDLILPEGIAAAVRVLENDPAVVAVFGGLEEWGRHTAAVAPTPMTQATLRFSWRDRFDVFSQVEGQLVLPLARREVMQRHAYCDRYAFGFYRLIPRLLRHGDIVVLPDLMYRHAHTPGRMEYQLTEPWYHDFFRADLELYFAEAVGEGSVNGDTVSQVVSQEAVRLFGHGARIASEKGDVLKERLFLLRGRAYGLVSLDALRAWEERSLPQAAMAMLFDLLLGLREPATFVVETGPWQKVCAAEIRQLWPKAAVEFADRTVIADIPDRPDRFVLVGDPAILALREARVKADPACQRSLFDLIDSLRVTERPLLVLAGWGLEAGH